MKKKSTLHQLHQSQATIWSHHAILLHSTHRISNFTTCSTQISHLPIHAKKALLPLVKFYDSDYTVILTKTEINIKHSNIDSLSLQGH